MSTYAQALRYETAVPAYVDERELRVIQGQGLDARARAGVTAEFVSRIRALVLVAFVLIALGACRVLLSSATVSLMQDNLSTRTQIREIEAANDELRAERSVLVNSTRIERIAEQELGMVHADERVAVRLTYPDPSESAQTEAIREDTGV